MRRCHRRGRQAGFGPRQACPGDRLCCCRQSLAFAELQGDGQAAGPGLRVDFRSQPAARALHPQEVIFIWLWSVCFNVCGLGPDPGQDGDQRGSILIITAASERGQVFKLPFDCQAVFLPPHLTSLTRRREEAARVILFYAVAGSQPVS
jgi:hypothetical protein